MAGQVGLDVNSPYAYVLWGDHFAASSVVAVQGPGEDLVGFVLGFCLPDEADATFVWQVAVAPGARGRGVGGRLLDELAARTGCRVLEATVTPTNSASLATFRSFAARHGAALDTELAYDAGLFPGHHEEEVRVRIGPLPHHRPPTRGCERPVEIFERLESEVRGYCRAWPVVFERAQGCTLVGEDGRRYLDFFAGAGALNYGHNHPDLRQALVEHLAGEGIIHGLDMATTAKRDFLARFEDTVLVPRGLDWKVQFPGPTGTNAVEAALKLARKVTGRERVVGFTNAFHGMTLGSLAVTGNSMKRQGAGVPLTMATSMPFEGFLGPDADTIDYFAAYLGGEGSGMDLPAAVIVETVQAEGGINVASDAWLVQLADLCRSHGVLLIVDDIQVGCGRTGPFFSWEQSGIEPDIVCLSKSLSGFGLPMALTLFKREHDAWAPGEHNGTFRGNNAAFVTATAALDLFWSDGHLTVEVERRGARLRAGLEALAAEHDGLFDQVRGRGLIQGVQAATPEVAEAVARAAFERGLVIETAGPLGDVVKLLPPLVVTDGQVDEALATLGRAAEQVLDQVGAQLQAEAGDTEVVGR